MYWTTIQTLHHDPAEQEDLKVKIVNIYIATDSKNTRKSKRKFGYVLECELAGNPYTKEGFGEVETTYNGAILIAINKALERLNFCCEVHIHTENGFVANMIENNLDTWAGADFKTKKGKPVVNQEEWKKLWEQSQKNLIIMAAGRHSYSNWIEEQMKGQDDV